MRRARITSRAAPQGLRVRRLWLTVLSLTAFVVLIALGVWQVERRAWKLELIARVEQRVHAPAQPITSRPRRGRRSPPQATNTGMSASPAASCMTARRWCRPSPSTAPAIWVLTPLRAPTARSSWSIAASCRPSGATHRRARAAIADGLVEITGLLRITEPKGGFLRDNVPQHNRWYSRDVGAIAAARDLRNVAPFFVDADAGSQSGGGPIGGLTVIRFPNNHLIYALTWFALAFMLAGRLLVTFCGGLFRRNRFVHEPAGGSDASARRAGSDAGTIVEPT